MKHSKYLDKLRDNKFKHLNMNHRDRDSFLKYISDTNTTCSNVKRRTRRQLNPDQYLDHLEPAPSKPGAAKRVRLSLSPGTATPPGSLHFSNAPDQEKFSLEALQKEEQQNLKARMQIEMLKNQTQLNQKDLLALESQAPPPSKSRFDQQFRPARQSHLAQPGVVVPQTIYVPNHPPPVVSMVSHPPAPQLGYDSSRMRSRSPTRQAIIERSGDSLSRAYEGHRSTSLRSRSPPAHSGGYGSSRHRSRSPGPRQASIDRPGGNGSLSRAYDEHQLRQSQPPRRSYEDYDPGYPTTVSPPRRSPPRRSPPRRWAEEPPQSRGYPAASRSPPRIQMNSPPQPRRWSPEPTQQTQASAGRSIADKWTDQMAGITNKRNDYNDAFERLAAQEAQREAEQLREVANNQQPQIIDLDSD